MSGSRPSAGPGLHFDALARPARDLWGPVASCLPAGAYLAGGSALALRFGHRRSYDLDLFRAEPLDGDALVAALRSALPAASDFAVDIVSPTRIAARVSNTRLDFTYDPTTPLSAPTEFGGIPVADIDDITAMKVAAATDRGALRDWYDLMAIQQRTNRTHRECFLLWRQRFGDAAGPTTVALVADRLCKWRPGVAGLVPDPHLCDIHGHPVQDLTEKYWSDQAPAVERELSRYKRRTARTDPPSARQRTLGGPQADADGAGDTFP